jgi:hypothetical protein
MTYTTWSSWYRKGEHVRIFAPGTPHNREVGTVVSSRNDAGDMIHTVRFADGTSEQYMADELISTNSKTAPAERD